MPKQYQIIPRRLVAQWTKKTNGFTTYRKVGDDLNIDPMTLWRWLKRNGGCPNEYRDMLIEYFDKVKEQYKAIGRKKKVITDNN